MTEEPQLSKTNVRRGHILGKTKARQFKKSSLRARWAERTPILYVKIAAFLHTENQGIMPYEYTYNVWAEVPVSRSSSYE